MLKGGYHQCFSGQVSGNGKCNTQAHEVDMASSGSCLQGIISRMYVKCARSLRHCQTDETITSLWMPSESDGAVGRSQDKLSAFPVSRCIVCAELIH